jgi:multiple sugar transport system substrate-binding protein
MKLVFVMVIAALLIITGCGSKSTNSDSTEGKGDKEKSDKQEQIELRMAWWGGQDRHDRTLKVIELYEEKNPNIKITAEYSGIDGYFDKLSTQFAAGNAPDLIQYGGNLNDYVAKGVVLPLDPYVGKEIDTSKHDKSMIDAATMDGKFYGVTLGSNAFGILLNKTLFEKAGVGLPDKEWTWEDLADISAELTKKLGGAYGVADFEQNGFGAFLASRDKRLVAEDGSSLGFEEKDVRDWFQIWQDMRESGGAVVPEIQASSSQTPEQSLIVQGKVAIQMIASNQFGAYSNASKDDFELFITPYEDGKNGVALRPSQFLAGNAKTEHPEEVAKFLDFMVNDEEAAAILGNDRGAPVNSDVREKLIENAEETDQEIFEYIQWVGSTSDAPYEPNLPGFNENEKLFKETSERISFKKETVEKASAAYYKEVQKILSKFN